MAATKKKTPKTTLAWHILPTDWRLSDWKFRRNRVKPGRWNAVNGDLVICFNGLHASIDLFDALRHCRGDWGLEEHNPPRLLVCRVECRDIGEQNTEKFVCRRRKVIAHCNISNYVRRIPGYRAHPTLRHLTDNTLRRIVKYVERNLKHERLTPRRKKK